MWMWEECLLSDVVGKIDMTKEEASTYVIVCGDLL
jgi:hypothetical protein